MKLIIIGGSSTADYVIRSFKKPGNTLTIINKDKKIAEFLSESNGVNVLVSSPNRIATFEDADITGYDVAISLQERDVDNYVTCMILKSMFDIKKTICIVNNPNNADVFKELGIDSVISSTQILAESVLNESNVEDVVKTLSLERGKITLLELVVQESDYVANKKVMELKFPSDSSIACLYRKPKVIIPNGQTSIKPNDKLTIILNSDILDNVKKFIKEGNIANEESE